MGQKWSGSPCNDASFNSTFAPDARVSTAVGATTGLTYNSIQDALDAGRKHIYIEGGVYNEDVTIVNSNVRLTGSRPPNTSSTASCVTIGGQVAIGANADYVTLENLLSYNSGSNGFRIAGGAHHINLIRCYARGATSNGFQFMYGTGGHTNINMLQCVAYECGGDGVGILDPSIADGIELSMTDCWIYSSGGSGIDICSAETYAASGMRIVKAKGCTIRTNVYYGIYVGEYASLIMEGCEIYSNNGGVFIRQPANSVARSILTGNLIRNNSGGAGGGISLSGTSSNVLLLGNICQSNGGTNFSNCDLCPGYATNGLTAPGTNRTV